MEKHGSKMRRRVLRAALLVTALALAGPAGAQQQPGAGPESAMPADLIRLQTQPTPAPLVDFPHTSLLFTVADVVFFSYENGTMLELYDSADVLVWNNGGAPLNKGEHAHVAVAEGVYRARGSEKFAVLTGDPITRYVVGYYAMDQDGYGTSTELYTWVPQLYGHCKFIVFGYEDATQVTVEYTDTGVPIAAFMLNKGEHWDIETLDTEWLHVTADKPVSALTCYDQGYYVPSATGNWSGTEFYTYVGDVQAWTQDLTVMAFDEATFVSIKNTDTNVELWSGWLGSGEAHVETFAGGADQFFTITSSKVVTVAVLPWQGWTSNYAEGAYVQDRSGAGIGIDLIGSTLDGGYLHILAYKDATTVDLYNSQTGVWVSTHNLNAGDSVNANPGNGLWRIRSDKYVSAYSGYAEWNADFAPVEFGAVLNPLGLIKGDGLEPGECVNPGDNVTYEICFDNLFNDIAVDSILLTDFLPNEVNFVSASDGGVYDPVQHTVVWSIGTLPPHAPQQCVELVVEVDWATPPDTVFTNSCVIESEQTAPTVVDEETEVCAFIPVYVDIKPGSCPNPLNPKSRGVLPVAILGTDAFDVETVDPTTIRLIREGVAGEVAPLRWSYEDVATPFMGDLCDCHDLDGDGYLDLTLKFDTQETVDELELGSVLGQMIQLTLTGNLTEDYGGMPIRGADCIWVLGTPENDKYPPSILCSFGPASHVAGAGGSEIMLSFDTAGQGTVDLSIFDVRGRRVRTLVDGTLHAGSHSVVWDGADNAGRRVAAGVYFARLSVGSESATKKVLLVK